MKFEFKSKFNNFIYLLLTLLFVCTAVNVGLNFADSGDSDLSNIAVAADQPTNTHYYWTDTEAQTEQGVDFTNYTLSGSGSKTDPYLIQSETDLAFLSWTIYNNKAYNNHVSSSQYFYSGITFKQTKDLNLSAYYWQPIGISYTRDGTIASRYFSGNYDGGGYTVSGVFTPAGSSNGYDYQGLFGYIYGGSSTLQASITNLGVIDSFVQGNKYVGGVVGYAYSNATVSNVYNTGSVSGSSYVGGVVGRASSSSTTVSNVYNTGSVSGAGNYVGGVVGSAGSYATISNVYNTGIVSGSSRVGGVVGDENSYATISNAYNTGIVSGSSRVGGVVGYAYSNATVSNVYNTGSVSGYSYVGGVVGYAGSSATVSNTYYGGDCEASIGGIKGADVDGRAEYLADLEALAKNEEWYLDSSNWNSSYPWNFETVWNISVVFNGGYPCFDAFWIDKLAQNQLGVDFTNYTLSGSGAPADPYLIQSEKDLAFLSWTIYNDQVYGGSDNKYTSGSNNYFYSDVYFKQTENLVLSAYYWQPIGIRDTRDGTTTQRYFSGNYDGGGYTVSGVFTPAGSGNGYSYQGLFGYVRGRSSTQRASIANLGVIDSFIRGYQHVGGVVGLASDATITNSYNTGLVNGSSSVGGVVGRANSSTITNCYNTGSVSASGEYYSYVGGVVGYASNSTISNAYNTGSVSGSSYVGGVVGYVYSSSTVSNVYNTGIVSGSSNVGGVVGYAYYATITNAYNTGSVSGSSYVGGVVGFAYATVSNVYNTGSVIGTEDYVGGIVGSANSSTVRNAYNTGSVSGSSYVGGVVGFAGGTVSNVYNAGLVSGSSQVGGVVGSTDATVSNVYNTGSVSGDSQVGGVVGRALRSATISDCGVECAVITGTSNVGIFVGQNASSSATIENCYAIVDGDLSPYGSNSGTVTNCLWIAGGVKYYLGTDFSGFAWLNTDSCPIPKGLSWMGQFWTENITSQITSSSDWTKWVA